MTTAVAAALRQQSEWCAALESYLYARLLTAAADDVEAGGPVATLVDGWEGDAVRAALPLRLVAGVHALVLRGEAPRLAPHFPTAGGSPVWPECRDAFLDVVATRRADLWPWLHLNVQTNEPLRSAVLLGGFLAVAAETGLPLRLLELGASAGLNLCFDRYRYDLGVGWWGPPDSPAQLRSDWRGAPPPVGGGVTVASRDGCDAAPVDAGDAGGRLRLRAYVWADQPDRLDRLDRVLAAVAPGPPRIEQADAGIWLGDRLAAPVPGTATVVFHSIVWHYLGADGEQRVREALAAGAERATAGAPLYWLRMELRHGIGTELTLTRWPDERERKLADCHAHGAWADWAQPA